MHLKNSKRGSGEFSIWEKINVNAEQHGNKSPPGCVTSGKSVASSGLSFLSQHKEATVYDVPQNFIHSHEIEFFFVQIQTSYLCPHGALPSFIHHPWSTYCAQGWRLRYRGCTGEGRLLPALVSFPPSRGSAVMEGLLGFSERTGGGFL